MLKLLQAGGWVMIPLAVASIVTLVLIIACLFTLRRSTVVTRRYMDTADALLRKHDYFGLIAISNRHSEAVARITARTLDFATKNTGATADAIREVAAREREAVVSSAAALRAKGHASPVVSVGSTPTATFADSFAGVTEVRTGVYVFHDLVMAGLGVCALDDIAISVLASVIGHQRDKNWLITDAGWMALSRDRGTAKQKIDQGYGVVCDAAGVPIEDLIVVDANQEHGIVARRDGGVIDFARYPIGTLLRVLPNHACATAAQHSQYRVVDGGRVTQTWDRFGGW